MAIVTLNGHVKRAIRFLEEDSIYVALGKTDPWGEDETPPLPEPDDEIEDIQGYKKIETKTLVIPDEEGAIVYRNTRWSAVTVEEAYERGARWAYVCCWFEYDELPTNIQYRQVGLLTGLKRKEGVDVGKYALVPSEVEDNGVLEVLDNIHPVYRDMDKREKVAIIMEF